MHRQDCGHPGRRLTGRAIFVTILAVFATAGCDSTAPTPGIGAPTLATPADDAVAASPPALTVNNVAPGTAPATQTYDFQVAETQAALTAGSPLVASASGVPEGAGQTSFIVTAPLPPGRRYFWRARVVRGGAAGAWSSAFRFRTDYSPNPAPVIQVITASSERAEVDGEVELTAIVSDAETAPSALQYTWTAPGGTFSGSGATVRWRAPLVTNPTLYQLTLTVIERYTVTDPDGRPETRENRSSASSSVHVNNSDAELRSLATTFIDDFIHPERTPEFCVRNFTDSCFGKTLELEDIRRNRREYIIDPARSSFAIATIEFNRPAPGATRATVRASCNFGSTEIATGRFDTARGVCRLIAVYEDWRWYLCESWFDPPAGATSHRVFPNFLR